MHIYIPLDDTSEVVSTLESLFLPAEDARRIDQRDASQHRAGTGGELKPVEEPTAKPGERSERLLGERSERLLGVHDEGVAGHHVAAVALEENVSAL